MARYYSEKEQALTIPCGENILDGLLFMPKQAKSLVLFVHGSGSSRFSSRNQYVAQALNDAGHATLLFDLLTPDEEMIDSQTQEYRFNIALLASRLLDVTQWCKQELASHHFKLGYFGASTGGGAAFVAAAQDSSIKAVVSRGGRPDLAVEFLSHVKAATLLIVGGNDEVVIKLNQYALSKLTCEAQLKIVANASHLFAEEGKLKEVSMLASAWFSHYL